MCVFWLLLFPRLSLSAQLLICNHFLSIIETITQEAEQTGPRGGWWWGRPPIKKEMITTQSIANFNYTTQHT